MALGDCVKMWSRNSGSFESEDLLDRRVRWMQGYTIDHGVNELASSVLTHPDLPRIGDRFENMPWVLCKRLNPKRMSPILTIVEVEYEGEVGPGDDPSSGSPIQDEPDISFENVVSVEGVDRDGIGKPIVTVNDEPIDGVTKPISDILMRVKRNFLDVNLPATQVYLDSVNSDNFPPFKPFPAGTGHLERFKATPRLQRGLFYWEVEAEILFRQVPPDYTGLPAEKAWWSRVRHEGYRHRVDLGGPDERVVNAVEANQAPVNRPMLLDENGVITDANNVHWLEFQIFTYSLPYRALGLV